MLSRPEVCMFLGPVGDVLWGTVQRRRVRQGLASYGPPAAETDPCVRQAGSGPMGPLLRMALLAIWASGHATQNTTAARQPGRAALGRLVER